MRPTLCDLVDYGNRDATMPFVLQSAECMKAAPTVFRVSEEDQVVMGLRHVSLPLEGVQFHPESVLTPDGPRLIGNFLKMAGGKQ